MNSSTIRQSFFDFFEKQGHKLLPSAPLVVKNDPSLLFTNSGMVQFKDIFLGNTKPTYKRVIVSQKCLRVSGKHNDLEDVGLDTYHHTFFEMLGNWSFGDYFKKDAIAWAWELLTDVYGLPKERLYVTVFGGDEADNLLIDKEASDLWKPIVGQDRIIFGNKKDNFWEMGDSGPCGPCSEIHIDLRPDSEVRKVSGKSLINHSHPQVIEIWNLVFIQYNRLASGKLEPLPQKHVDTGMGFERLCSAIQAKESNYDTDIFSPLIEFISLNSNIRYGENESTDIAIRVMVDHVRAVAFAIAEGQLPSNNGAGYVIRRILRRAVRYGFSKLNFKEPFLYRIVPLLSIQFKDVFPELHRQVEYVSRVLEEEELSFLKTLDLGIHRFEQFVETIETDKIEGGFAFELYDTFGFPFDLTSLMARERGLVVDETEFYSKLLEQKTRSKVDAIKETSDWNTVQNLDKIEFVGYDFTTSESRLLKYRTVKQKDSNLFQLVFDKTPFYAEGGGQVGDIGMIETKGEKIKVLDTKKENSLIIHITDKVPSVVDQTFLLSIDKDRRMNISNNHSATHLLHASLRKVLGSHVEQKGSLVNEKILRFDFSHFASLTDLEIAKVETMVNQKIRDNINLEEERNLPLEKAKNKNAMALFGEKYEEFVRVITFDPNFSVELCGGTHVVATGNIGFFKIISESSVATGIRRIEAVASAGAEEYVSNSLSVLKGIKNLLKNPNDLTRYINNIIEEKQRLEKKLTSMYEDQANTIKKELFNKAKKINGYTLILENISVSNADMVKMIAFALRNQFDDLLLILSANINDTPHITVMIGKKLVLTNKFDANIIIKELAKLINGGGGGQQFYATAGGQNLAGLGNVLAQAKTILQLD